MLMRTANLTGAIVARPKFLGEHMGVCTNATCSEVRHTHPNPGYPVTVPISLFSDSQPICLKAMPTSHSHAVMSLTRAMSWQHPYSILNAECEDLAYHAFTGEAASPQRNTWIGVIVTVGLLWLATRN